MADPVQRTDLLDLQGVSKTFGDTTVLKDLTMKLAAGEILAIVGQNGSGKSTLIKTLSCFQSPDSGSIITAWGQPLNRSMVGRPSQGLHFIHQDLALTGDLTTIENLNLVKKKGFGGVLPTHKREEIPRAQKLLAQFGGSFDVTVPVSQLAPSEQALVAIARAFDGWDNADNVLVLDEPTASLHPEEARPIFTAMRNLAAGGTGVILVSHRLNEVVATADRVLVLRDGATVTQLSRGEFDERDLVELMSGTGSTRVSPAPRIAGGRTRLQLDRLAGAHVKGAELRVAAGEIVGVTGLIGSGRDELAGLIFGSIRPAGGTVRVDDHPVSSGSIAASMSAGIGYVPADRKKAGIIAEMYQSENMTLSALAPLRSLIGTISGREESDETMKWIEALDIRPRDPKKQIGLMSGGNQQKVVLSRWLRRSPKVLVLDEPTQGVDVAAKRVIHRHVADLAASGSAVVVCSSDLEELMELCHRVLVFREGEIVADLDQSELSESRLTLETLGISDPDEAITEYLEEIS